MFLISVIIENLFNSVEYGFTKNNRMKLVAEVVVVTDYYKFNILFTKLPPPLKKNWLTTDERLYLLSETVSRILIEQVIGVPLYWK